MHDLRWTMPVARWSATAAAVAADINFIEPIVRRRLSSLSRIALKVAHDCVAERDHVRVVFASRHGELRRTTDILRAISAGEPVSPTAFSLSVLNAMTGIFGIARGDRSPASAISAGAETLGYALLEAHAQFAADPSSPVLVVYADEQADAAYGTIEDEVQGGALAILLDARAAAGRLACTISRTEGRSDTPAPTLAPAPAHDNFRTQSEAVQRCLDTQTPAAWQNAGTTWQWSWHESTT
ncbi:beta-ketoacyl synthase chain length factor [Caballeronia sp. SEWSISQ10-4 2]|uniref:beta-ketoacyl synthase chain length factor n=1 Tax=Caballeronia sp. SEWSISQ10-4 2 TaxID=2937438 RepID=UPI00264AC606|nr:beta-ketoacyl synthase chain length factor [Caballeronia sp. SEWSISQ10-4 2]MDN7179846.1 beta-ketoacyl synthase chain length factor [Caballeronia sp. SEWSISQ10-4 2]